jgi:hypothetical protein
MNFLARIFPFLFSARSSSSSSHSVLGNADKDGDEDEALEEAEMMIWGSDKTSKFDWDQIEGVEISWGASSVNPNAARDDAASRESDGLEDVRRWMEEL